MDIHDIDTQALPRITPHERRRYPRIHSHFRATVRFDAGCSIYYVRNLSVCGALLTDGLDLEIGMLVELEMVVREHAPIRVVARVVRRGMHDDGTRYMGVEFRDVDEDSQENLQVLLLDELERQHSRC